MINQVTLVGNVGKDAVVKNFSNGNAVLEFSLATTEKWKKDDEWQEKTEWHNVKMFSKYAESIASKILRGTTVAITGKITYRSFDDKDGNKKYITEIIANDVKSIGSRQPQQDVAQSRDTPAADKNQADDDDLPF